MPPSGSVEQAPQRPPARSIPITAFPPSIAARIGFPSVG